MLERSSLRNIGISALLTIFGIFVQPVLEIIAPPLFSGTTLLGIVFLIVVVATIMNIVFWQATQKNTDVIEEKLSELSSAIGQQARLVPYDVAYKEMTSWVREASEEVRILAYYGNSIQDFDSTLRDSDERKEWFDAMRNAIERCRTSKLQFVRIVQRQLESEEGIPRDHDVFTFLRDIRSDTNNMQQVILLTQVGEETRQRASLRISRVYTHHTFVLVDRTKLFLAFDIQGPTSKGYKPTFAIIAEDPAGKRFEDLKEIHEMIEKDDSMIVKQSHLEGNHVQ